MVAARASRMALALALAAMAVVGLATPAIAAETANGTVYVIQGVDAATVALSLDGRSIAAGAPAKTIVGPLSLTPGEHTLTATGGGEPVTANVTVTPGGNIDAVLHRQVDPSKPSVFTVFPNDLSPVAAGSGRVAVAHTAAVGPADIRVNGKVLFANVANGESLTLTVPAGSYGVDIVPAAATGPVVFGPVTLPVQATSLTRVFAIGVAATGSMDAVVQVLPLTTRGSGTPPAMVNAGDGGQAQALIAKQSGDDSATGSSVAGLILGGCIGLVIAAIAVRRNRRGR